MKIKKILSLMCSFSILVSSLFCCKAAPTLCKVAFAGDSGSGKTQVFNRLINNCFNDSVAPTVGSNFATMTQGNIQCWDITGDDRYRCLMHIYLKQTTIAVLVLDVSQSNCSDSLNNWIEIIDNNCSEAKKIVVLNKSDLCDQNTIDNLKQQILIKLKDVITEDKIIVCSAKDGTGIDDLKNCIFQMAHISIDATSESQEVRQSNPLYKIYCLATAGICALSYGTYKVYKKLTSKSKDANVEILKNDPGQNKVSA